MLKRLGAVWAVLLLTFNLILLPPLPAHAEVMLSGGKQTSIVSGTDSSNATISAVSADDTKKIRAYGLLLSASSADTITVKCGGSTNRQLGFYLPASSGVFETLYPLNLECRAVGSILSGTVATTSGSATITGTNTTFTASFAAGDRIVITSGDTLVVQSVDSDTQITATTNASNTVSGKTFKRGADRLTVNKGTSTTPLKYSIWYDQEISP